MRAFWPLVVVLALLGLTARLWNLDFDQRQHPTHPIEGSRGPPNVSPRSSVR